MAPMVTRELSSGAHTSLSNASFATIIGTGLLLGVVHVLTGPDHLSALAAMTTGSSWRAFSLGLRWGCGHSLGLLIMAAIFFAAGRSINLDHVGVYLNYVVGAFMIALGLWTARQVKRKYRDKAKATLGATGSGSSRGDSSSTTNARPLEPMGDRHGSCGSSHRSSDENHASLQVVVDTKPHEHNVTSPTMTPYHLLHVDAASDAKGDLQENNEEDHTGHHHKNRKCCKNVSFSSPTAQRVTALLVGIIHGIAGPGGILGVLPAVVMANWAKSTAYLASFCLSSIFIMGVFAALYGEITGRLGRNSVLVEFRIGIFSSAFSIIVGIAWIILQATGYMDKVFE